MILTFKSAAFDYSLDPAPEYNEVAGRSSCEALRIHFKAGGFDVSDDVDEEDWGYYFDAERDGVSTMIGVIAFADFEGAAMGDDDLPKAARADGPVDHIVQFERRRSMMDRLLGRNKMAADDPIYAQTEAAIRHVFGDVETIKRETT